VVARSIKQKELKEEKGYLKGILDKLDKNITDEILKGNKETIGKGSLLNQAINQGISFIPGDIAESLIKNFSLAKQIYGDSMIRFLSNYNPDYVSKNIVLPEFQREIKNNVKDNIDKLNEEGLIKDSNITQKGLELASVILLFEELNKFKPSGSGDKKHEKDFVYGDKDNIEGYKKGIRYRDIAIRKSLKLAIRRNHKILTADDIKGYKRKTKGKTDIVYALDASGSMKGKKIEMCKKAGIALAFKAIENKDKVGLVVFSSTIKSVVNPTNDFLKLLFEVAKIRALNETDIKATIESSVVMFRDKAAAKHLMLITDALPTIGKEPEKETLEAVEKARNNQITISLVGINLNDKGKELAGKIVELGNGRLYIAKKLEELEVIVLDDYYNV
tara:strand:+ start:3434 stop:4600 length:1167 start_codon:yes stop_codon:yes gene_type:complete